MLIPLIKMTTKNLNLEKYILASLNIKLMSQSVHRAAYRCVFQFATSNFPLDSKAPREGASYLQI